MFHAPTLLDPHVREELGKVSDVYETESTERIRAEEMLFQTRRWSIPHLSTRVNFSQTVTGFCHTDFY